MNAHQIITGALNNGENVYALGNIEGITFTACAVGADVVILDSDFNRVQIIPGKERILVSSLSCCQETGKIAATYGTSVKILEATSSGLNKIKLKNLVFQFTWIETYCFHNNEPVTTVLWTMEGLRLLFVISNTLVLYQHKNVNSASCSSSNSTVTFCISEEENIKKTQWEVVWTTSFPFHPKYVQFSPDGNYLALSGDRDCFIKVFYQNGPELHNLEFSSVTLNHPAPVCGFEWRKTGRYMPKRCIQSALISWCDDKTSRIWKESPPSETSVIDLTGEGGGEPLWDRQKNKKFLGKHIRVKKTKTKILGKLRNFLPEKKSETENCAVGIRAQIGKNPSLLDMQLSQPVDTTDVQFHLAATINCDSDCLLVPSIKELNVQKSFCVHWLNNKELVFTIGAEKLLAEAVIMDIEGSSVQNLSNVSFDEQKNKEPEKNISAFDTGKTTNSVSSDAPSFKDILDVKLEILLRQWTKSNDVFFAIHPVDGSLLTWTIEWLDDNFRQPIVSYNSRLPCALPPSDSMTIHSKLNTFNPYEPVYLNILRADLENRDSAVLHEKMFERHLLNTIHVLTSHNNGTLNLWHMTMDSNSQFSQVVSITHISRMCGHRFQIEQIVAHPVLPLLITTSKFDKSHSSVDLSMDVLSEVILWKVTPVGPLCKEGGVKELARVTSSTASGFSTVGWVPTILPNFTLGSSCNSPSSCFVSFDGMNLIIYQAVLDARTLLTELSVSKSDSNVYPRSDSSFNIASTQSTAKPGCVLEVGKIENAHLKNVNLLYFHIFQSKIIFPDKRRKSSQNAENEMAVPDDTNSFEDQFFIVMVDRQENEDIILMFSMTISTECQPNFHTHDSQCSTSKQLHFDGELVCRQTVKLPDGARITKITPSAGHLSSASIYPACEAPYVLITSDNDDVIRFWHCEKTTATSAYNKYEWREWKMIGDNLSELGVEGPVLDVTAAHSGRIACVFDKPAQGKTSVDIAVFECESSGGVEWLREDTVSVSSNKTVALKNSLKREPSFNKHQKDEHCQSDGEQKTKKEEHNQVSNDLSVEETTKKVRLAWVSTEDGSHMLTVALGTEIHIFAQVSEDPAQQNVSLMRESETIMRRPSIRKSSSLLPDLYPHSRFTRWVCCRVLALDSADGLPAIPTALSWVRDGILIIGLQSEMRVYNQWNFKMSHNLLKNQNEASHKQLATLTVSASHTMLDQVARKKDAFQSIKSRHQQEFSVKTSTREHDSQMVLENLKSEGVFEAARMCSPILPQYHPKQLTVLLNAGKKKQVQAILKHVLISLMMKKNSMHKRLGRGASLKVMDSTDQDNQKNVNSSKFENESVDYHEIEDVPLLPLYTLMNLDEDSRQPKNHKKPSFDSKPGTSEYDELFDSQSKKETDIEELLEENSGGQESRSRNVSEGRESTESIAQATSVFTAKDNRNLTDLLTHTHLPGLSSVDQMHLLAIADTLCHFNHENKDKINTENTVLKPILQSVLGDAAAGGYATAAAGIDTIDECGLKYLMAMKQHEFLLVCLPMKQRMELKKNGLSAASVIWAQHSETETELLNAVPGIQKSNISWDELKGLGIAWWLKNTNSLKICIEKLAKAAFQQNQDPMDASLFYLALRKKKVLTHLFKTARNETMAEFFMNDFNSEHWKKVAAKNAFVLMSKQRFQHAAAFFLLSGSLKDAVQTILSKCNDIQLALVIVRLYETDLEVQQKTINSILCREVLGTTEDEFEMNRGRTLDNESINIHSSKEPFERSMAFWIMKDYIRAAHTLVQEAQSDRDTSSLSNIFNFHSYLRKHPLVVRQRLNKAGAKFGTTEQFLALGKKLECFLIPSERRLFFRTAAQHMARGCPMLALDVLTMLPGKTKIVQDYDEALKNLIGKNKEQQTTSSEVDWSAPTEVENSSELDLKWSSDEEDENDENVTKSEESSQDKTTVEIEDPKCDLIDIVETSDIFAQHMKFVASLQILTEELSTLINGLEMDSVQLKQTLLSWLENEIQVLKTNCGYYDDDSEALEHNLLMKSHATLKHRDLSKSKQSWLKANQKLIRSFTSFCTLHSAHNHKLASILIELLFLLLHVQQDGEDDTLFHVFPLLNAVSCSHRMFVSSPLAYIENQCSDILFAVDEITEVPNMTDHLQKSYVLYNLSQAFSCCIHQSLCSYDPKSGPKLNRITQSEKNENQVVSPPVKWPGAEDLIALMGREKEEDSPQLRLLIVESFLAIFMSLFCFALSAYDSRWLYRIVAHEIDPVKFGKIFGGGGEKKENLQPPARPPRPSTKLVEESSSEKSGDKMRSRLNLRVLGCETMKISNNQGTYASEPVKFQWIPPKQDIMHFFAEKPNLDSSGKSYDGYESEDDDNQSNFASTDDDDDSNLNMENVSNSSFAWQLMRLALIYQQLHRVKQFLVLVGLDPQDVPTIAPRIDCILRQLTSWIAKQQETVKNYSGGIPDDLLPDMTVDMSNQHLATSIKKYAVLVKKNNTPFEVDNKKARPIKRLWSFLVCEDHLQETFIKYIFSKQSIMEHTSENVDLPIDSETSRYLPEAFKIVQKDNEPILSFSCNHENSGMIVVSNGREIQEMDISDVFKDQADQTSWMWNRADLDMKNINTRLDALRDNDDYQIFTDLTNSQNTKNANIIIKRPVAGVRRIDSHPHAPFYVTGSSDGSIKVWRWGVRETIYTARVAGQHAKVTKIAFSCNGNKFAAVDGDGMLCLWQASHATNQKKPFFSQRCHNKSASDVRFLGHSSSVLLTAGSSSLDYNLGLWDTLLPTNRALVHSWTAHPEGATCAMYLPGQQTIFSGGRHGEICLWDVRQRQLRHTIKAFDQTHAVKCLVTDSSQDLIVAGSSEGDIKIWSADTSPTLMYSLPGEHGTKGGFSFRQVGQSSIQGVQQLFIDQDMRLFSCGADSSLKFRILPSIFNMTSLL